MGTDLHRKGHPKLISASRYPFSWNKRTIDRNWSVWKRSIAVRHVPAYFYRKRYPSSPYSGNHFLYPYKRSIIGIYAPEYSGMRLSINRIRISLQRSEMNDCHIKRRFPRKSISIDFLPTQSLGVPQLHSQRR